jgi:hypothetical protein
MWRFVLLILVVLSGWYLPAHAQRSIRAHPLSAPLTVDGIHEPERWAGADSATGFFQMAPRPGEAATAPTVAYIGFDQANIYVSVKLYQETEVMAKALTRDILTKGDDSFALVIDPYNDNRSGYGFWTNPLGTQTDFRINDDGRSIDINWDAEWITASRMDSQGWTLEMAIPFKSLRFKPGTTTWGVNFGRIILDNLETVYWSGTLSDDFRISQGGKLTGIEVPDSKGKLTLFPYASLRYENNEFTGVSHEVKPDVGGM